MATHRDILNEQKWRHQTLERVTLTVIHRGAPGDVREVFGEDILEIGATGLVVEADLSHEDWEDEVLDEEAGTGFIPYHRITRIVSGRTVLWQKDAP